MDHAFLLAKIAAEPTKNWGLPSDHITVYHPQTWTKNDKCKSILQLFASSTWYLVSMWKRSLFCCFLLNPHFVPQKNQWNHHEKPPYPYFPQKPAGTTHCPHFVSFQWWSPWLRLPLWHTWPSWGQWAPRRSRRRGAHSPPGARKRDGEFKKKRLKSTKAMGIVCVFKGIFNEIEWNY